MPHYKHIIFITCLLLVLGAGCATTATNQTENLNTEAIEESGVGVLEDNLQSASISNATSSGPYLVVRVIDGDTIDVETEDGVQRVRLIGIDTPETVDPRKPVQCFGKEASAKAKELLEGEKVMLEADFSQDERDKYDRLLRYVFLPDGRNFDLVLIEEGYAREYTYNTPYKYQQEFKEAERIAQENKRGLWADDVCPEEEVSSAVTGDVEETAQEPNDATSTDSPNVKKSTSDICHARGTTYYEKTKNFTPYNSVEDCLASGGRLPAR